ncbi:hypothetical protein [Lederbergia galactosidilytica]|uniref:hypothetical protein n=1 Tax=Lederbergia galactosidilytica TaxID=217031 RepID=UPI000AB1B8A0|nr:hypothetical protein [Lederbergia galactosidilytica]MBP1914038.1 hypothetical protein [Lederbergia galactosidilytica]
MILLTIIIIIGLLTIINILKLQYNQNKTIIDQNEVLIESLDKLSGEDEVRRTDE